MMVNGVWYENISCLRCKFRHPAELSCEEAKQAAIANRRTLFRTECCGSGDLQCENCPSLEAGTTDCKWCGASTRMLGTKMCDGCWELDTRIRSQMELAERILNHYKEDNEQV